MVLPTFVFIGDAVAYAVRERTSLDTAPGLPRLFRMPLPMEGTAVMKYAEHISDLVGDTPLVRLNSVAAHLSATVLAKVCLLYTSPSPRDRTRSRMPSSA